MKKNNLQKCKHCKDVSVKTKLTLLGFKKGVCGKCKKENIYISSEAYFIIIVLFGFAYYQFPTFWNELNIKNFQYGILAPLLQNLFVLGALILIPISIFNIIKLRKS